jgi:hypothetical protein
MRLTLRTLLAYLDDVLPADEKEVLRQRIEESEFASTLVQRIRHTLHRQRLTAPKLDGKGLGADPNTVAEYLDSLLPSDRTADFERGCLESDIHLAEIASCHKILCKVLQEPAQITAELRNKLHDLPALLAAGKAPTLIARHRAAGERAPEDHEHHEDHVLTHGSPVHGSTVPGSLAMQPMEPAASKPVPVAMQQVPLERPKPEVPDYLKPEPTNSRWQLLSVLAFMGVAAVVLLMMSPVGKQWLAPLVNRQELANESSPPSGDSTTQENTNNKLPDASDDKSKSPAETSNSSEKKIGEVLDLKKPVENDNAAPPDPEADDTKISKLPDTKLPPENGANPNLDPEMKLPDAEKTATPITPPAAEKANPETKPAPDADKEPPAITELGRYISDETVLARYSPTSSNWLRVPARSLISSGDRLVSLPIYRPQIALASGVQVTLAGEASFTFDRGRNAPIAMLTEYGRFLLVTAGASQASIELDLNGLTGVLTLPSADALAAVEVYNYAPPGVDPQANTPIPVAYIYSLNGSMTWEQTGEAAATIQTNQVYTMVGNQGAAVEGPVKTPAWVDAKNTASLDRESAKMAEGLLALERPLTLSLEEIADHRRIDVRVHVARSLANLGAFETIVRHLSLEEYRPYTPLEIETLRAQMSRGGEVSFEIQSQLEKLRGSKDGTLLYRLLYGFDATQLVAEGKAEQLVEWLEHSHADVRWLAFDNLKRITGVGHSFNPALPPEKNRSPLVRWSKMLKDGEINYAAKPSPLQELQPLPVAPAAGETKETK